MWTPTHVQVTVHRAKNLLPKGKQGTNDAYVTITCGKEKYQTSVKSKTDSPEWHEECDLAIPDMNASVHLNTYHRSFLGLDDFLGHVSLPLAQFPIYERPHARWYALKSKPGSKKAPDDKYRGEIEVKITFIVQSNMGSQPNLANLEPIKRKGSMKYLSQIGDKLKLPARSNSFKSEKRRPVSAIIEPLVHTPPQQKPSNVTPEGSTTETEVSDLSSESPKERGIDIIPTLPPLKPIRMSKLSDMKKLSVSTPRLTMGTSGSEQSVDSGYTSPTVRRASKDDCEIQKRASPVQCYKAKMISAEQELYDIEKESEEHADIKEEICPQTESEVDQVSSNQTDTTHVTQIQNEVIESPFQEKESKFKVAVTDDLDRFNRTRQPIYRSGKLKRTASDADTKYLDVRPASVHEGGANTPLLSSLTENREITRSLGRLNDHTDGEFVSNISSLRSESKPRSSHSIPETITEVAESPTTEEGLSFSTRDPVMRPNRDHYKQTREVSEDLPICTMDTIPEDLTLAYLRARRHTLQTGTSSELPRVPAHQLHEGFRPNKKKSVILPPEVIEQYNDYTKEELINMVHEQKQQMAKKDTYLKDMENYIDNLLVRVMEVTPKLLQNPYKSNPYGNMSIANSSSNIPINGHHSNIPANHPDFTPTSTPTKKPVSNPFKKLQTRN